jgi:hypothetical protein
MCPVYPVSVTGGGGRNSNVCPSLSYLTIDVFPQRFDDNDENWTPIGGSKRFQTPAGIATMVVWFAQ